MYLYDITIAFFFKYELQQVCNVWDHSFVNKKKSPKPSRKLRKKSCIQLVKKPLKFNKKTKKKTKDLIDEKTF